MMELKIKIKMKMNVSKQRGVCVCDERKVCSGRKMLKVGQFFNWVSG